MLLDEIEGLQLHNGGQIKFGPDNKIYWSIGDQFTPEVAQDLENDELERYLFNEYYRTRSVEQADDGTIYLITSNLDRTNHPYGKDVLVKLDVYYEEASE